MRSGVPAAAEGKMCNESEDENFHSQPICLFTRFVQDEQLIFRRVDNDFLLLLCRPVRHHVIGLDGTLEKSNREKLV